MRVRRDGKDGSERELKKTQNRLGFVKKVCVRDRERVCVCV